MAYAIDRTMDLDKISRHGIRNQNTFRGSAGLTLLLDVPDLELGAS